MCNFIVVHNYCNNNNNERKFHRLVWFARICVHCNCSLRKLDTIHGTRKQTSPFQLYLRPLFPDGTTLLVLQVNGKDVANKEQTENLFAETKSAVTILVSRCLYQVRSFSTYVLEYGDTTIQDTVGYAALKILLK